MTQLLTCRTMRRAPVAQGLPALRVARH